MPSGPRRKCRCLDGVGALSTSASLNGVGPDSSKERPNADAAISLLTSWEFMFLALLTVKPWKIWY